MFGIASIGTYYPPKLTLTGYPNHKRHTNLGPVRAVVS